MSFQADDVAPEGVNTFRKRGSAAARRRGISVLEFMFSRGRLEERFEYGLYIYFKLLYIIIYNNYI